MYRNHNIISFETRRSNIQETIIIISAICHVKVHWSDIILLVKLVFFCEVLLQHAADDIARKGLLSGLLAAKSLSQIPRDRAARTDRRQ